MKAKLTFTTEQVNTCFIVGYIDTNYTNYSYDIEKETLEEIIKEAKEILIDKITPWEEKGVYHSITYKWLKLLFKDSSTKELLGLSKDI